MIKTITRIFLGISGIILALIGFMLLTQPIQFFESNGIVLETSPSLLSELKAPGGLLLISGFMILYSVVSSEINVLIRASKLTVLVYGAYGIARVISMITDGIPAHGLVIATGIEIIIAMSGLLLLALLRRSPMEKA